MNTGAYIVLLAIGTAAFHDTGRRMEIDVIAASALDAAVIAERNGNCIVEDHEYCYAKRVRPIRHTPPKPSMALALAA